MLLNALLLALREIRRNLMRAFLTVLGIVIGVAAVITMVTLGQGATDAVTAQVASLGSNLIIVRPGAAIGMPQGGVARFKMSDAPALVDRVSGIEAVAPVTNRSVSIVYQQKNWTTSVVGSTPEYFQIANREVLSGRAFSAADLRSGRAVCVIGNTVRKELFANDDPIGAKIRVNTMSCEVIGTLAVKGQSSFGADQDDTILLPITTLQRRLAGRQGTQQVGQIFVSGKDGVDGDVLVAQISAVMRELRNIAPNESDDFSVMDTRQIAQALSSTTRVMTSLLGAVAGVSLLVGGIGIMNIMLVSVTERTREIGIRLAIGALPREVLLQFLVEAVTLSSLGGLIGVLLALLASTVMAGAMNVPFTFDLRINLLAFGFAAAVGVIFGFMPARRAAQLDPIEALRHE
ncbi:ABC transporter permease [Niveibacterium umoris]|uniref:Putative ABC transport system permease protein n=1 Tax=Niveibacterium umoris TaxID=1193620 RepID=A0A840BIY1_9RHOO|nr:ABC transporter permease [Niveibacterium umoris]MBB4012940.1 putative ABC transport system permease protein [Niveibacterium umoris]